MSRAIFVFDEFDADARSSPAYQAAYRKAGDEATAALEEGRARMLTYGMLGMSALDPDTGLGARPISGCLVSDEIMGRSAGNNERIRKWIGRHGHPVNSLIAWRDQLTELDHWFEKQRAAGAIIRLRAGGPELTSTDRRFRIRQKAVKVEVGPENARELVDMVGLEIVDRGKVAGLVTDRLGSPISEFAWGPPGAPFAVVSYWRDGEPAPVVLHLSPVDLLSTRELNWRKYMKEHPEDFRRED